MVNFLAANATWRERILVEVDSNVEARSEFLVSESAQTRMILGMMAQENVRVS